MFHVSVLICVCVSACVPVSLMVPGGRPVSISRQQALVLCQSIDGPPVLDSRPLPTVTRWVYVWQCVNVCVIDIQSVFDTYTQKYREISECVLETEVFVYDP